ncbi:uncharacterized protein BDV14DRAFT_162941 [Aspergillus stella-maris]|uniref:uncharacterized protein n=1 Tax=Aspergillus stella-maris TaxID=1810926 RepID=UPI003CCE0A6B
MSSKLPNDPASFTDAFNSNVDYTRAKGRATTGMGRTHQTQGVNLAQTQSDAQADEVGMSTTTDTSGAGVFGGDEVSQFCLILSAG